MKTSRSIFIVLGRLSILFVYAVPIVWLGLSFVVLSFIGRNSYPALMQWYVTRWPTAFDPVRFGTVCFTPARYAWLTGHLNLLMAGIVVALGVYLLISRRVFTMLSVSLTAAGEVLSRMKESYSGCTPREKGWLVVLFGAIFA